MTQVPQSFASMPSVDDFEEQRLLAELQASMFGAGDPVQLGRYAVGRRLGSGAMGVVYEAEDPRLRRRVALKVLHPDLRAVHASRGHQRLRREAQSLSRVSHPNVIDVYDVGESKGRVYLAMELVDGVSLETWLAQRRRTSAEILGVFMQAGQGVAAAHDAGVIHRDFKPSNASVDAEGRVRVLDFGLAKVQSAGPKTADTEAHSPLASHVTRDDALVGTPRYMAPELLLGQPATDRSDQYAFCVALFEALLGRVPFDEAEMVASKLAGNQTDISAAEGVSRRVSRALKRGLSPEPSRRFGSMQGLLGQLDPRPGAFRRWAGGLALLAGAAAVVTPWVDTESPRVSKAADVEALPAGRWDGALARARELVAENEIAAAEQRVRGVLREAQEGGDRLTSSRAAVQLGRLLHLQGRDEEALDVLESGHVDAVVGRAHDERAETAAQLALILLKSGRSASAQRWLRDCRSTIEGTDVRPETELSGLLAEVEQARQTGKREVGAELAAEAVGLARDLADPREEEVTYTHAATLFELKRFDEVAVMARELLARSDEAGKETAATAAALMLLAGVESTRARGGDKSAVDASIAHGRRGVKLYASLRGVKPLARVRAELNLSHVLGAAGEHAAAAETLRSAVLRVRSSPELMLQSGTLLADLEAALGYELVKLEAYREAEERLHRAVLIFHDLAGPNHPHLRSTLSMLARAQTRQEKHDLAAQSIEQALAIPGSTDVERATTLWGAAEVSAAGGHLEEAAQRFELSAQAFERVDDPEGADMVRARAGEVRDG
ncbi:MAG: protein kinase domain-containing protein [Nannocystales bacterium]